MIAGMNDGLSISNRLDRIERMLGIAPGYPYVPLSALTFQCPECKHFMQGADGHVCEHDDCPIHLNTQGGE